MSRSFVRLEDVAVFAVVVVTPLVGAVNSLLPVLGDDSDFLGGLISFLAAAGAIAALLTRVPGETRLERPGEPAPERIWMIGPFIVGVGFVAGDSLDRMGLPGGGLLIGGALVAILVSLFLAHRLPVVPSTVRRAIMAPFVLLSAAFFSELASDVARSLGPEAIGGLLAMDAVLAVQLLAILGLAAVPFYLALIFVPRELADPGDNAAAWIMRFAVFYVSLLVAIALGGEAPVITAWLWP